MDDDKKRAMEISEKITFYNWNWDYEKIAEKILTPISENAARVTIGQIIEDKAFVTWTGDEISIDFGPLNITFTKADLQDSSEISGVKNERAGYVNIKPTGEWVGG